VAAFELGVRFQINGVVPRLVFGKALGSAFAEYGVIFTELGRN
jgi:hypothetical protein